MARLKVITGFADLKENVSRVYGDEFIVEDKKRINELIKAGVVEPMHEIEEDAPASPEK